MNRAVTPETASEREAVRPERLSPASVTNPDSFAGQIHARIGVIPVAACYGPGCQPGRGTTALTSLQRPAAGGSPAHIQPQPLE
jgi:hypothetical protein